jgi:hypothetical protein
MGVPTRFVVIALAAVLVLGGLGLAMGGALTGDLGSADDRIRAGTEAIANAIEDYAGTYGTDPTWDQVHPSGDLAAFLDPWPTNPLTGGPMQPASYPSPGDYTYGTARRMPSGEYRGFVTGYLSDGTPYPVEFDF